jgi:stage V sporulation protein D (sporulation-specific penicillin-binding protein)
MRPQNGEILAMVNVPEFDLNDPFTISGDTSQMTEQEQNDARNAMWRNSCISDTYEPGSTFKIVTAAAGLEEQIVSLEENFYCPGYILVGDRRIRCHKTTGHGSETFLTGTMNSCNPVFIDVGLRLGIDTFDSYLDKFGLKKKTGIDLPGEAGSIFHQKENMGQVELATVSFGQSIQITPLLLASTACAIVNGGKTVTPHLGVEVRGDDGTLYEKYTYDQGETIISEETSETMRMILERVVAEGSGKNAYIEGYEIGGKTATSETLPRGTGRYISSFLGFAPADDPQVLGLCIIYNPQGTYYGGIVAAPVLKDIYENILPYLGLEKK